MNMNTIYQLRGILQIMNNNDWEEILDCKGVVPEAAIPSSGSVEEAFQMLWLTSLTTQTPINMLQVNGEFNVIIIGDDEHSPTTE